MTEEQKQLLSSVQSLYSEVAALKDGATGGSDSQPPFERC